MEKINQRHFYIIFSVRHLTDIISYSINANRENGLYFYQNQMNFILVKLDFEEGVTISDLIPLKNHIR